MLSSAWPGIADVELIGTTIDVADSATTTPTTESFVTAPESPANTEQTLTGAASSATTFFPTSGWNHDHYFATPGSISLGGTTQSDMRRVEEIMKRVQAFDVGPAGSGSYQPPLSGGWVKASELSPKRQKLSDAVKDDKHIVAPSASDRL